MSGGKKKKTSSSKGKKPTNNTNNTSSVVDKKMTESTISSSSSSVQVSAAPATSPTNNLDVLDRLAPPILFFPPNVSEEYLNRFCPVESSFSQSDKNSSGNSLAEEGFPDREIPVMRRLLAMMAGIMSKASAASARAYYSRVAGSEGRRNEYFQQNLNTSVFNLFNTLSAAAGSDLDDKTTSKASASTVANNTTTNTIISNTAASTAFMAKDGEPLRGYPLRLMKFWRQLSPDEQLRLVKEEHSALTNAWIESRQAWCLCAHCKHRRMTISDLTDCLYQTYCEELEAFISSGGQGSTLYSPTLASSTDASAKARRFLFKSLSVVGEQALLPRYNQFIMRLEAFSALAFGNQFPGHAKDSNKKINTNNNTNSNTSNNSNSNSNNSGKASSLQAGLKSAALRASKEFLAKHGIKSLASLPVNDNFFDTSDRLLKPFGDKRDALELAGIKKGPERFEYDIDFDIIDSDDDDEDGEDEDDSFYSDDEEDERRRNQGGIQSEDDDDLIDEETDLPVDESELMLPGGASFPLLPVGDGPVQWSESSRIECGRTVFLMFASEMFQYRLTAAFLAHQTRLRREQLMAEVEAEERVEKEKRAREEKEKREKAELEKKKKAAKKEKSAAKAAGGTKKSTEKKPSTKNSKKDEIIIVNASDTTSDAIMTSDTDNVIINSDIVVDPVVVEPESIISDAITSSEIIPTELVNTESPDVQVQAHSSQDANNDDDDDFDPNELIEELSKEMNRFEMSRDGDIITSTTSNTTDNNNNNGPPGFSAPPPGFSEPKHLSAVVKDLPPPPPMGFAMPPFSLFNDNENHSERYNQFSNGYKGEPQVPYNGFKGEGPQVPYNGFKGEGPQVSYNGFKEESHSHSHYPYHQHHQQQGQYHPQNQYHQQGQYYYNDQQKGYYYDQQTTPFNHFHNKHHQPNHQQNLHDFDPSSSPSTGQSRFQSFFSNSIFGPSSFFSQ